MDDNDDFKVSPKYFKSYLITAPAEHELDRMIDVFEDRTSGWFLNYAKQLNESDDNHCDFAVLKLTFSYFEMIEQYLSGKESHMASPEFFKKGILKVFPHLSRLPNASQTRALEILYENARCGFYHSGMTKGHFFTRDHGLEGVDFKEGTIYIDRYKFVDAITQHLRTYVSELREEHNDELRANFKIVWETVNNGKIY